MAERQRYTSQRFQVLSPQEWDRHRRRLMAVGFFLFLTFLLATAALVLGLIFPLHKRGMDGTPPTFSMTETLTSTTTTGMSTTSPTPDLNCSEVAQCIPPPEEIECPFVFGCLTDGDLTLNTLTVNHLTVSNVTQVDVEHRQEFLVDNLYLNQSLTCSSMLQIGEGCPIISTVNTIPPNINHDFTLIGGAGITVTGGMDSLTLDLDIMIDVPEEFMIMINGGMLGFTKKNQSANTVWAGPSASGTPDAPPTFRPLVPSDIPALNLSEGFIGILSVEHGGTGNGGPFDGNRIIVSSTDGQSLVEGTLTGSESINITVLPNGEFLFQVIGSNVIQVDLEVPSDIFQVTSPPVTYNGTHVFEAKPQSANTVWAGPSASGAPDAVPTFRPLVPSDIPALNLSDSSSFEGVLSIEYGGTGNVGPFDGDRVLFSTPTSIVEGTITGGTGISVSISSGELTIDNTGVTNVGLAVPSDIFNLLTSTVTTTGTLEFAKRDQLAGTVWAGPVSGALNAPTFRPLEATDLPLINVTTGVTGVLTVNNGGTGMAGPYDANRVIFTSADGTQLIESGLLNDGDFLIGSSGMAPSVGQITSPNGDIIVTPGPGSIQLALSESLSTTDLTVTGNTFLGNVTSCANPLESSCYDISNQVCSGGPLGNNCIPANLIFTTLTVTDLTVLNNTILGDVISQDFLNVTDLLVDNITLEQSFTCPGNVTIDSDCFEIAGKTCPEGIPIAESCIPASLIFYDVGVTNNLTVNNVVCNGGVLQDACIPTRVKTISGIPPNPTTLDFDIQVGTGLSLTTISNGILLANTGVTSVGLAAPTDLFVVSGSPVTTTGSLTFTAKPQAQNTVWAGPVSGVDATPSFRPLTFDDFPPLGDMEIYYGSGGHTNLTSSGTVDLVYSAGELTIVGTGVSSVGMTVPASIMTVANSPITSSGSLDVTLTNQVANTVWAGPSVSGDPDAPPTFRALVLADLPAIPTDQLIVGTGTGVTNATLIAGTGISVSGLTISNTGVTSVGLTSPGVVYEVTNSPVTSTGTLTLELIDQAAGHFFAGPIAGGADMPSFRAMQLSDLPIVAAGKLYGSNGTSIVEASLTGSSGIVVTPDGMGSFDISTTALQSVGLTVPSAEFSVANSPLTADGTLVVTKQPQAKNLVWAGPIAGVDAEPTFRGLDIADLTSLNLQDGQLIVGSTGGAPVATTLTAGANVVITNSPGGITISASVNETMIGTVTSVGLSAPSAVFDVSGSPITSAGTLGLTLVNQTANVVWAGPGGSGDPDAPPTFRYLTLDDLPSLTLNQFYLGIGGETVASTLTAGTGVNIITAGGLTTFSIDALVSSVGLDITGPLYTISGSPVTTSGTLTATLNTQAQKTFFAGPSATGPAVAEPTFRVMELSDMPALANGQLYIGQGGVPVASGLSAGTGISITTGPGTITISATAMGEANTASNVGTAGVGVFKQKTVYDLEFKKLYAATASLTIVDDVANDRIAFSVIDSQINHDALLNFVSNEHVDHSTVSITGGEGIQGGGDLTASRTLSLDVNSLAVDATPAASNYILEYDVGSGTHKKVLISDLPGGGGGGEVNTASNVGAMGTGVFLQKTGVDLEFKKLYSTTSLLNITDAGQHIEFTVQESLIDHDALFNFVSNEHIDHSAVSITGGIGLTGGGDLTVSRSLDLDINSLAEDTNPTNNDFLLEYDTSTGTHKKVLISSLPYSEETMINIGTAGIGVYKQKTGNQFELKKLYSDSVQLNIIDDIANDRVTFSLDQSWIDHDLLMHYEAAEHVNHSAVSIVAGQGLSGGGTIEATRTLDLDVNSLTADASPQLTDYLLEYDVSTGTHKKVLISALPFGAGDFSNGGDVAGAHRSLGNTDAYDLSLLTSGATRFKMLANGQIAMGMTATPQSNYKVTIRSPTAENGLSIHAGDNVGDIALNIYDQDDSTMILQVESNGYITLGKTYAQTITDNTVAYGMDNQNTLTNLQDFNTQHGGYRIGGMLLNINHLTDVDTSTVSPSANDVLKWDGANWVPADMSAWSWQGPWVTATAYGLNDVVSHNGASYVCILGHTSGASSEPLVGGSWATYWQVVAERGDQGAQGTQGPQGIQGTQGVQGVQGPPGLDWKGEWTLSVSYLVDYAVKHMGRSFICTQAHTSSASDEPYVGVSWQTYWDLLAEKGDTGTGSSIGVKDEGVAVTGGPFTDLNFVGTGITATDGGAGQATITVTAPVFGQNFQTGKDTVMTSTGSTTFVQRQRLTTPSLPSGTYRIEIMTMHSAGNSQKTLIARAMVNGATQLFGGQDFAKENSDSGTEQRETYHGADYYTGSGVLDIDIDYKSSGGATVSIYYSSITIWRVQ